MEFLRRRLSDGNFLAGGADSSGPPRPPPTSAPLLLVVGRPQTDWVKLFRGKSVHGDVELRVEQAQFSELSCLASSHGALTVTIEPQRGAVRRLRPDFVLLREAPLGGPGGAAGRFITGLLLGGVPASTPLSAAITAANPAAALAQAMQLQKELGSERFPMAPLRFCHRPRALLTAPHLPHAGDAKPRPRGRGHGEAPPPLSPLTEGGVNKERGVALRRGRGLRKWGGGVA
ncbi:synapsin-1-like isoform X4 [Lagopus muta]|uniref:synapsin-1-like isoform X4 n=1 Tax=Lagopus muta TaxID=64668 RepID=UPI0020A04DB5|nr:synapsin-1-like isoform X4 [Lagopus muta]